MLGEMAQGQHRLVGKSLGFGSRLSEYKFLILAFPISMILSRLLNLFMTPFSRQNGLNNSTCSNGAIVKIKIWGFSSAHNSA